MTEVSNYPEMDIIKIVNRLDPDCPDPGAYIDGHCSIAELVLSSMKTPEWDKIKREDKKDAIPFNRARVSKMQKIIKLTKKKRT